MQKKKKLDSSSHSEIRLKLLADEAALNFIIQEKHSSCWNDVF